jgi:hypothetical protein
MLLPEQRLVLEYLRRQAIAPIREVLEACLHGTPLELGKRVLADLEWLGHVTVYSGGDGEPVAVQITDRGRGQAPQTGGPQRRLGGLARP